MKETRDDPLLRALAEAVREEQRDALADPRWDALAAGTATAADRAALDALAANRPEAAGAVQVFTPLGAGAEDRFAAAIHAEIQRTPGAVARPIDIARSPRSDRPPIKARPRRWAFAAGGGVIAMAAAIALFVWGPWDPAEGTQPSFEVTLSVVARDHVQPVNAAVPGLSPGSTIVLSLRPTKRLRPRLEARVFLIRGSEATALPTEILAHDASRLEVRAKLPTGPAARPGDAEIIVVVGGPRAMPPENVTRADEVLDRDGPRRRIVRRPIRFER